MEPLRPRAPGEAGEGEGGAVRADAEANRLVVPNAQDALGAGVVPGARPALEAGAEPAPVGALASDGGDGSALSQGLGADGGAASAPVQALASAGGAASAPLQGLELAGGVAAAPSQGFVSARGPLAPAEPPSLRDVAWTDGAAQVAFLEVLEGDHVVQRHRLDVLPVRVGRGYGNHVILDDPKVSARHLTVERRGDGALVVRDAGSRNGTYRLEARGRATRLGECAPADDTRVSLGDTVLRFRSEDHPVADTLVAEAPGPLPPRRFESRAVAGLALLAAAGSGALTTHLESPERPDGGRLLLEAVVPVLLVVLWAGAWSLGTRAARRRFHAVAHAAVAALAFVGMAWLPRALGALTWGLGWTEAWLVAGPVVLLGVAAWALYWHLRYLTRLRPRGLATGLGLVVGGLALLLQLGAGVGDEDFVSSPQFARGLYPPALQLASPRPVDAFVDGLDGLQEQVDAAAREAPAD